MTKQTVSPGPRYEAMLQVLRTSETLWNASRVFFEQWELSPSQFNVLNILRGYEEGLSQVELSRLLIMHRSNVTGLVDRLEKRELLQRKESATDRRVYLVVLTASGRKLLAKILPEYYEKAEQIWEGFPIAKANELAADLQKLSENVDALKISDS